MVAPTATPAPVADRKRIGTAHARAALIGAVIVESHDDRGRPEFILTRWSLTRAFGDLDDLESVLDRMGAPK